MPELRYFTAGESHGQCLIGVIDGLPAGLKLDVAAINRDLARRQKGYGRGGRMKIETDQVEILSGIRLRRIHRRAGDVAWCRTKISRSTNCRPSPNRARAMPTSPVSSNTTGKTPATFWNEPAPAKPRCASPWARVAKLLLAEVGIDFVGHLVALGPVQRQHRRTDAATDSRTQRGERSPLRRSGRGTER